MKFSHSLPAVALLGLLAVGVAGEAKAAAMFTADVAAALRVEWVEDTFGALFPDPDPEVWTVKIRGDYDDGSLGTLGTVATSGNAFGTHGGSQALYGYGSQLTSPTLGDNWIDLFDPDTEIGLDGTSINPMTGAPSDGLLLKSSVAGIAGISTDGLVTAEHTATGILDFENYYTWDYPDDPANDITVWFGLDYMFSVSATADAAPPEDANSGISIQVVDVATGTIIEEIIASADTNANSNGNDWISGTSMFSYTFTDGLGFGTVAFLVDAFGMANHPVSTNFVMVPEPGTVAMFSIGLLGLGFVRRRRPTA